MASLLTGLLTCWPPSLDSMKISFKSILLSRPEFPHPRNRNVVPLLSILFRMLILRLPRPISRAVPTPPNLHCRRNDVFNRLPEEQRGIPACRSIRSICHSRIGHCTAGLREGGRAESGLKDGVRIFTKDCWRWSLESSMSCCNSTSKRPSRALPLRKISLLSSSTSSTALSAIWVKCMLNVSSLSHARSKTSPMAGRLLQRKEAFQTSTMGLQQGQVLAKQ